MSAELPIDSFDLENQQDSGALQCTNELPQIAQWTGEEAHSPTGDGSSLDFISADDARSDKADCRDSPVELGSDPDLWLYRERTIALLRRYLRISVEVGRLPSLLGRELFRSKVTSYRMSSFEDAVIFVHDVERALHQL